jgi:hypothetical protein
MKMSMVALGKAVSKAVISGRHAMTKPRRKTQSIGPDIEWWDGHWFSLMGTAKFLGFVAKLG